MENWWVFIQDTNGSRRFVGAPYSFATETEAEARVAAIEAKQNKAHKVDYWTVECAGGEAAVRAQYSIEG